MTLILRKKDTIPISVTGGLSTVAIRIPSHPVARILLETTNLPIAAPSANISGKPSSTTFENVLHDFKGRVDVIIDGGDASISLESTVIDMTSDIPIILRPGSITQSMIEQVLKTSVLDQSEILIDNVPKAPGMKYKHYAPMATLKVIRGSNNAVKA
ncbi:MAG: L-threonylcarbamoyladenylate synthase [Erysipelotrichaceae bacterium]|nr:L-threonylcarbamoyladenylate synthase [Erysipelotrichaceae bacterium]